MKHSRSPCARIFIFLGAWGSLTGLHAGDESQEVQPRIWILPFSHAGEDPEKAVTTGVAISEVLTVLVSQATGADVVDRDHLDQVLAEHSLSRKGLLSPDVQLKIGRLLGATVLVSGSFMERRCRSSPRTNDCGTSSSLSFGSA